jgi:uncharacterized protein with PIN domain
MSSKKMNTKRMSVCADCGIRLSAATASGKIRWQPSQVDDDGLYCEKCYEKHAEPKSNKDNRPK